MPVEIADEVAFAEPIQDRDHCAEILLGSGDGFPGPKYPVPRSEPGEHLVFQVVHDAPSLHVWPPVVAIGAALIDAGIPALRPQRPILSKGRGHGKLRSSVYDAAAIPGPAMALEEGTIGHVASRLG